MLTTALVLASLVHTNPPAYPAYNTTKTLYAKNDLRGKPAPKLVTETVLNGAMPDTKGKVIVVDFWATWCPPCRELIPEMNDWAKEFKDQVVFVGISDEKPDVVKAFMEKTPMTYTVAVDTQKRMITEVGVQGIPHVLVISPDGIVRWQGFPLDESDKLTSDVLKQIIAASTSR